MRRELKKRGISHLKVVFSTEEPKRQNYDGGGKLPPASVAFVPSVAGLIAAGEAIKDIIKN
jgi:tRNA A37 threonylcarbamoyladenosine dehydratase